MHGSISLQPHDSGFMVFNMLLFFHGGFSLEALISKKSLEAANKLRVIFMQFGTIYGLVNGYFAVQTVTCSSLFNPFKPELFSIFGLKNQ